MTSTNDTTILAMITRYPDMSDDEADTYLDKLEHEESVNVGYALLGRIRIEDLPEDQKRTAMEIRRWSDDRTRRTRNEQTRARENGEITPFAQKLLEQHERGLINDQFLIMYGVSGELPDRTAYYRLSDEEKVALWEDRMRRKLGPNWRDRLDRLPNFLCRHFTEAKTIDWIREGF